MARKYSKNIINVGFNLMRPNLSNSAILVHISYRGKRLRFSSGFSIAHKDRNEKTQRLKPKAEYSQAYNFELSKMENTIKEIILQKTDGFIWEEQSSGSFKQILFSRLRPELKNKKEDDKKSFLKHFNEYIEYKKNSDPNIKPQSLKSVRTTYNHVVSYSKKRRITLTFNSI